MKTILVALDESEVSERVARFVNSFFDADTTKILALNVAATRVPWVPAVPWGGVWGWGYGGVGMTAGYPTYAAEGLAEEAERQEREGVRTVLDSGIQDAETVVEQGDPVTAIERAAEEHGADLIVVGSHDRNAISRVLFGSVTDDLVHKADRPVLVVR